MTENKLILAENELYVMYLDAERKLRETILDATWEAMKSNDTKRMKQIHSRLAKLASDCTNPDWLQPKGKSND